MVTPEQIDGFLGRLASEGASYEELEPGLWKVQPVASSTSPWWCITRHR